MGRSLIALVLPGLALAAAYLVRLRPRVLAWGATTDEARREMPGDQLVPEASLQTTRAVTIEAPPGSIWPWLVQMGLGRAPAPIPTPGSKGCSGSMLECQPHPAGVPAPRRGRLHCPGPNGHAGIARARCAI